MGMQRISLDIFDRLGNLIRSLVDDEQSVSSTSFGDPDMQQAWSELEQYMDDGSEKPISEPRPRSELPEQLRRDYRSLELPPGAPLDEVKRAYKKLMAAYHPDRHSADPERMRAATEVTKRLNQSYHRIVDFHSQSAEA